MRFKGKVALIAGAGSSAPGWSNGMAVSVALAREGAMIAALDTSLDNLQPTLAAVAEAGADCLPLIADVTQSAALKDAVDATLARFGRIDILFNNVGLQALGGPEEISEETWDRLMSANVKSVMLACKHVLPVMRQQRAGVIINNSSLAAISFLYPSVAYSSSKGAVDALTRNLAVQVAPDGIRVVAVRPGLMATPRITQRLKQKFGDNFHEALADRHRIVPMGRMGDAWDVAHAVTFLASDEARYITATELIVDGGLSASVIGHPWRGERNL